MLPACVRAPSLQRSDDVHRPQRLTVIPSLVRGVAAGAAGTAAMSLWYVLERRLLAGRPGAAAALIDGTAVSGLTGASGLDYDDSVVPGQIVASIIHLPSVTDRQAGDLTEALRWSYGSAFGVAHVILRDRMREPGASVVFGGSLMTMTLTAFPLLGRTPPPWRWPVSVVISALGSHAAYVATAAVVDDRLRRPGSGPDATH